MSDEKSALERADELTTLGAQLHMAGNVSGARVHYDGALLLNPEHPLALQNLSGCLMSASQFEAALCVANRAVLAEPRNILARANRAAAMMHLGRFDEARRETESVLKLMPDADGQWHNYSLMLYQMGHIDGSLRAIQKSIQLCAEAGRPIPVERLSDMGIFTLATGDLALALDRYEVRWKTLHKAKIWDRIGEAGIPEWRGEDLVGRRLLVHHEQGFGDGIMLVRFVKRLAALGASVSVAAPKELVRLFSNSFPDVSVFDWESDLPPGFDFHSPMLSVLRWLKIEPAAILPSPYLVSDSYRESLGPNGRFMVGVCWESGDHSPILARRRRVVPLDLLFPLTEIPGVRLVSLQKGEGQKDIVNLGAESFIFDPMARVEDFADTAAIISRLDLVVSVDSAVAHLAGALGKPTFVLGPYTRCWRWWKSPSGLPWYENMRIFRCSPRGDWSEAARQVIDATRRFSGEAVGARAA